MFRNCLVLFFLGLILSSSTDKIFPDERQVSKIHKRALTVDTHVDTPMLMVQKGVDIGQRNSAPDSRVDLIRAKEGGLDVIFFAAFTSQKVRTPENIEKAYQLAHRMIDSTYAACHRNREQVEVATRSDDARRLELMHKTAIYLGMENGFPLGTDLSRIEEFYHRGVRYITLCHSKNNDICDSSTDRNGPEHHGLSLFGRSVVEEMNRLGMMIDVSHISDQAFYDVLKYSKAPVFASHSSVRAIANHQRNLSDDMIRALAKNGGVIQICLLDDYVRNPDTTTVYYQKMAEVWDIYNSRYETMTDREREELWKLSGEIEQQYPRKGPSVSDFVDHIDHVRALVGIDYVGIGSDFDGGGGLDDCRDVSHIPEITREMLRRGYRAKDIEKVWGGNFFRVFSEVEREASLF